MFFFVFFVGLLEEDLCFVHAVVKLKGPPQICGKHLATVHDQIYIVVIQKALRNQATL